MRSIHFVLALLTAGATINALAADPAHNSCPFLARDELKPIGVTKDTTFMDSYWAWGETPKETPTAQVVTNLCTVSMKSKKGNTSIILAVDRFDGKVSESEVGSWIKAIASKNDDDEDIKVTAIGDATCESGNYELPTTLDDRTENINTFYVACDTQVGTRHVSLNVHVPEAEKTILPSPEKVKAILDNSVQRLKAKAADLGKKT